LTPSKHSLTESTLTEDYPSRLSTSQPRQHRHFEVGELVWGPRGTFSSWPGKVAAASDDRKAKVYFFGNRETAEVEHSRLKSLMEGLEEHHKERNKLRK